MQNTESSGIYEFPLASTRPCQSSFMHTMWIHVATPASGFSVQVMLICHDLGEQFTSWNVGRALPDNRDGTGAHRNVVTVLCATHHSHEPPSLNTASGHCEDLLASICDFGSCWSCKAYSQDDSCLCYAPPFWREHLVATLRMVRTTRLTVTKNQFYLFSGNLAAAVQTRSRTQRRFLEKLTHYMSPR